MLNDCARLVRAGTKGPPAWTTCTGTEYETSELVTAQILPGLLGGPALADTAPLKELIARYIDHAMLVKIAREYDRPRVFEHWQRLLARDCSADRDHVRSARAVAMSPVGRNL